MTQPVLDISHLTVALPSGGDRRHAVADMSLRIAAGEVVCLLGESGSGKSVVAHAIMGLLPRALAITHGSICVQNGDQTEDLMRLTPGECARLRGRVMSIIFQEPMTALNPMMRCGAQIEELLRIHSVASGASRRQRVMAMLARVHFDDPLRIFRAFPHQLSGGQRQRVMIAMALIMRPALLICDEPTTALDVTTQAEILKLIAELKRDTGMAILFITHDIAVARRIAERIVVMQHGQVVETGTCPDVLGAPQHTYTRELIQAVPSLQPKRAQRPDAGNPVLTVRGLYHTYRQGGWFTPRRTTVVAENIQLQVSAGETLGVVGESGCGKSSLARMIAQLLPYDRGDLRLNGQPLVAGKRAAGRPVQMVFQDPYQSLNPRRSVLESLIEGPLNAGVSRARAIAQARRLIARVHLSEASLWRYPHEFSGGQRQRICIARALACEPALLIADEAVSALDVSVQRQILDLLEEIQTQLGLAMIFITHDLRVAARLCDRILVMQAGKVVECDTARAVLLAPRQPYTRQLLAATGASRSGGTQS